MLNLIVLALMLLQAAEENQFGGPLNNLLERKIEKVLTEQQEFGRENGRLFGNVFERIAEVRSDIQQGRAERQGIIERIAEVRKESVDARAQRRGILDRLADGRLERIKAREERGRIIDRLSEWTPLANIGKRIVNAGWWLLLGLLMIVVVLKVVELFLVWLVGWLFGLVGRIGNRLIRRDQERIA